MNSDYEIKDISLAAEGRKKINWVSEHMPILNSIKEQFIREKPFRNKRIAISVHLEAYRKKRITERCFRSSRGDHFRSNQTASPGERRSTCLSCFLR